MLNGTAVVDRMALAILENFEGDVPEVLEAFGAPSRIRRLNSPSGRCRAPSVHTVRTCGMRGKCASRGIAQS